MMLPSFKLAVEGIVGCTRRRRSLFAFILDEDSILSMLIIRGKLGTKRYIYNRSMCIFPYDYDLYEQL